MLLGVRGSAEVRASRQDATPELNESLVFGDGSVWLRASGQWLTG